VELFFNLLWVGLCFGLVGVWLVSRCRWGQSVSRPSTFTQIAALAVLLVILFPVVSLTDDLVACTTPAEAEHLVRRDFDHAESWLQTASIVAAGLTDVQSASETRVIISNLTLCMEIGTPREEFLEIVGNRPPPRA